MASRSRSTGASDEPAGSEEPPTPVDGAMDTSGTEDPGGESPGAAGAGDDGARTDPAPEPAPEPCTDAAPVEMVTAEVIVSALWADRTGTKILRRGDLWPSPVAIDDRRLGKTLGVVEGRAPDPGVAATLAALAEP